MEKTTIATSKDKEWAELAKIIHDADKRLCNGFLLNERQLQKLMLRCHSLSKQSGRTGTHG